MSLRIYLLTHGLTIKQFAEQIGVSRLYLGLVANGKKAPSKFLAKEI